MSNVFFNIKKKKIHPSLLAQHINNMGHRLNALITEDIVDIEKAKELGLAVSFEKGFAIVILFEESLLYYYLTLSLNDELNLNLRYANSTTFHLAKEIGSETYTIIETDYWMGIGEQNAMVFRNGSPISKEGPINISLKIIGVIAEEGKDEFDTLNLGEYSRTEWYYWDTHNQAYKHAGMIPGKVLKRKS
jgi:hypothetical protein